MRIIAGECRFVTDGLLISELGLQYFSLRTENYIQIITAGTMWQNLSPRANTFNIFHIVQLY